MSDGEKQRTKPTKEEHEARIEECVKLLRARVTDKGNIIHKGMIKKLFREKYGCHHVTTLRYIKKAQDRIVSESNMAREVHRTLVGDQLAKLIWGSGTKPEVVIAAAKLYSDLHGLVDKSKIVVNNDSGTRQHLHLHGTPLTLDQRKQALLEHLGISSGDSISDDRGGDIATRTGDVIEVPRQHSGGSGSAGGRGASDSQGMEIGTESNAGQ